MNYELTEICKTKISKYLDFDVSILFDKGDFIAIFGGAVRDSLADKEIYDVDILCLPETASNISKFLIETDWNRVELYSEEKIAMYKDISCITEPWTFIKNTKIIQIIKPAEGQMMGDRKPNFDSIVEAYYKLLSDVDISACGVFLEKDNDGIIRLKESHPHAITHCRSRVFEILQTNRMYSQNRSDMRGYKLRDRDWINLNDFNANPKKVERRMKLYGLQKPEYPYKVHKKPLESGLKYNDITWL